MSCTGVSDTTAGNITIKAESHMRHLLSPHESNIALVLLPLPVHFSCLGALFMVSGCDSSDDILHLDRLKLWLAGELVDGWVADFLETKGDATASSIDTDSGLSMEKCELSVKQEAGTAESSGLGSSVVMEKCEVSGKECTYLFDLTGTQ